MFEILKKIRIFEILSEFNPVLVGSFPIQVDIASSDVDIICESKSFLKIKKSILENFSSYPEFEIQLKEFNNIPSMVTRFNAYLFSFEIFSQEIPTLNQKAFIHLEAENRLLDIYGEMLRETIIQFKEEGFGTEKSFALAFGVDTNEYEFIEKIHQLKEFEIINMYSLQLPGTG